MEQPMTNRMTFREIADVIDGFDEEARELNARRKEFWKEVREQVPLEDQRPLKDAIKLRYKRVVDRPSVEKHEARVAEILADIERKPRAMPARVAKSVPVEPHNPETGEIIETGSVGPRKAADTKPDGRLADKSSSPIQESREEDGCARSASSSEASGRPPGTAAITSEPAASTVPDDAVGEPAPAALVSPPFSSDDEPELPACLRRVA